MHTEIFNEGSQDIIKTMGKNCKAKAQERKKR
jgi:hypothetical protein